MRYLHRGQSVSVLRLAPSESLFERRGAPPAQSKERGRSPRREENLRSWLSSLLGFTHNLSALMSADTVYCIAVCVIAKGMDNQRLPRWFSTPFESPLSFGFRSPALKVADRAFALRLYSLCKANVCARFALEKRLALCSGTVRYRSRVPLPV